MEDPEVLAASSNFHFGDRIKSQPITGKAFGHNGLADEYVDSSVLPCHLLEAAGDIDRVTDGGELTSVRGANIPDDCLPGMNSDTHAEGGVAPLHADTV